MVSCYVMANQYEKPVIRLAIARTEKGVVLWSPTHSASSRRIRSTMICGERQIMSSTGGVPFCHASVVALLRKSEVKVIQDVGSSGSSEVCFSL